CAVATRPRYPDLHLALARERLSRRDLWKARESCDAALAIHPDYGAAALELARVELALGGSSRAERLLIGLIPRYPSWADAHALLGSARRNRGNRAGTAEASSAALRLNPGLRGAREDLEWASSGAPAAREGLLRRVS